MAVAVVHNQTLDLDSIIASLKADLRRVNLAIEDLLTGESSEEPSRLSVVPNPESREILRSLEALRKMGVLDKMRSRSIRARD